MLDLNQLFNNVAERDLDAILQAGEGQQIEFLEKLPSVLALATQVSSFANAQGGVLVIGAREKKPQIVYSGDERKTAAIFDKLPQRIRPLPQVRLHMVNYRGAIVPVIVVKPHNEIVVSDAGAIIRAGDANQTMTPEQVKAKLPPQHDALANDLALSIAGMTQTLNEVRNDLRNSRSFRGQLSTYVIGFFIGIAASWVANQIPVLRNVFRPFGSKPPISRPVDAGNAAPQ